MFVPTKKRLGELLIDAHVLSQEQLRSALEKQKGTNERLGKILVDLGYVTESDIIQILETQLGIRYMNLAKMLIDPEIARLIPENLAKRYKIVPVKKVGNRLILAMVDPLNVFAIDDVRITTGLDVEPVIATETDIVNAITSHYGLKDSIQKIMGDMPINREDDGGIESDIGLEQLKELVEDAPVVKLVNTIIQQAVLERASDIHVEPQERNVRVRYRIDGVLRDITESPKKMQAPIISRLKIMANMDIAERRVPQDGRIQTRVNNKEIDLRVSTLPTIYGEKVVLRVLDKSQGVMNVDDLGFTDLNLERFKRIIHYPHGIILVTGPTGSGKTTTLYAVLNRLNSVAENILTLEDPVEYTLPGVNQVQLNTKAGLTFASGLRSILRQDPDIIMVGEIRDSETAKIAVQSAMTGHLVLSTLHTNSAAATIARLIDMEIEPFLVSSSVVGIVAQRLVRALCPDCKEPYRLNDELKQSIGLGGEPEVIMYRPKGCPVCNNTGYLGRLALQEVLIVDTAVRNLIIEKASAEQLEQTAIAGGMTSLRQDGLLKARVGLTSLEEVMRIAFVDSIN